MKIALSVTVRVELARVRVSGSQLYLNLITSSGLDQTNLVSSTDHYTN